MKNYDRIKNMSVEEMARKNVGYYCSSDMYNSYYNTSDGKQFDCDPFNEDETKEQEQLAIQYEINWLNTECEVEK